MRNNGIYRIRNLVNDKCYVGSAGGKRGFRGRWNKHLNNLKNNKNKPNPYFQNAWNKVGEINFFFEVLEVVGGNEEDIEHFRLRLIGAEQYWMDRLQPEYNTCPVAGSLLGYKQSEKTIQKRIKSNTGKKRTKETKRKMSIAAEGNKNSLGYKWTEEQRKRLSKAKKGKPQWSIGKKIF